MYKFKDKYKEGGWDVSGGKTIMELVSTNTEPEWSQIKKVKITVKKGDGFYAAIRAAGWKSTSGKDALIINKLKTDYGKFLNTAGNWDISKSTMDIYLPSYQSYVNYINGEADISKGETKTSKDAEKYKKAMKEGVSVVRRDKQALKNKDFSSKGFTLNKDSKSENTDFSKVFIVQKRLQEIYNYKDLNYFFRDLKSPDFDLDQGKKVAEKIDEKKALTESEKSFINSQIQLTVTMIKGLQEALKRDDFEMLERIESVYSAEEPYKFGQLKYNDPTYIFLQKYWIKDLKYETGTGDNKKTRTERVHNFYLNEKNANLSNGIKASGVVRVDNKDSELKKVFPNSLDRAAYTLASKSEAKFDGINTWDSKRFSYGHIQFAGHSSLFKFLSHLKENYPKTFAKYFSEYGIDIVKKEVAVFDFYSTNKLLKGDEAVRHMSEHLEYAMVFKKAAWNTEVRKAQLEVSKDKFIDKAEDRAIKIPKLKQLDKDGKTVKTILGGYPISKYKEEDAYKAAKKLNHIAESSIKTTVEAVTTKKETRAAVYMIGIHRPNFVQSVVQIAVLRTITVKKITSLSDLKNKCQKELLKQIIRALKEKEAKNEKVKVLEKLLKTMK